jgi:hypothetical protein
MSRRQHRYRAATVIIRTPAFWVAAAAYVTVLAAFLLVWGDGIPSLAGSVLEQTMIVQTMTLAVLLPWVAARCRPLSRPAFVRLATAKAQPPSRLVIARAVGLGVALAAFALAGLPMLLLALHISAAPFSGMMLPAAPVVGMIPFVAILSTWCELLIARRLTGWLVSATLTVAVALLPASTAALLFSAGAAAGFAALGGVGNRFLRHRATPLMRTRHV